MGVAHIGVSFNNNNNNNSNNSVALVRGRTIPTERLPLFGEVSANSWCLSLVGNEIVILNFNSKLSFNF
jgi:hypothetical protein